MFGCRHGSTLLGICNVDRMLNLAEHKRRQSAPGVKVTLRNFGHDRRYPIVNRFRDPGTPLPEPDKSLLAPQGRGQHRGVRLLAAPAPPGVGAEAARCGSPRLGCCKATVVPVER